MQERSNFLHAPLKVNAPVIISVSQFDRGPSDDSNLPDIIVTVKNKKYSVATAAGLLKNWLSRNQVQEVPTNNLKLDDIDLQKKLSIREAVAHHSLFNGQGYKKCNCSTSKTQCRTNRCTCFKNNLQCNSRCHTSSTCANK